MRLPQRLSAAADAPLRGIVKSQQRWDRRYERGALDRLKQVDELAHYGLIVGYFHYFKRNGSILDVGCGEGILLERLGPHAYSQYVGLDISAEAIRRACGKPHERAILRCVDVNTYTPPGRYDAVVFNESLYCFEAPLDVVHRYERCLKSDGVLIMSIVDFPEAGRYWSALGASYRVLDEVTVTNKSGVSWTCKVLTAGRRRPPGCGTSCSPRG